MVAARFRQQRGMQSGGRNDVASPSRRVGEGRRRVPADVQTYIVMTGATSPAASQAARDFLARLTSVASDAVISSRGWERVKL
jgi:hypothetical protein